VFPVLLLSRCPRLFLTYFILQSWFIQGHETAVVKDSSDDLWFLESDSSSDDMVEYEVISLSSDAEVGLSSTAESPPHMIIEERQVGTAMHSSGGLFSLLH